MRTFIVVLLVLLLSAPAVQAHYYDGETGLDQNGQRDYNPGSGRYIESDPIGLSGGINLYGYVGNDPIDRIDPRGLTWATNWNFFWDWARGQGANNRYYGPNTVEAQEVQISPGANALRNDFYSLRCTNRQGFIYGTGQSAWDTVFNPGTADWSSTAIQAGGFAGASAINNGDGTVTFTISNVAGTQSFFYHIVPDRSGTTGPMRNINQTFQWKENINANACGCGK
jgi:RHS repeat-associated protein